MRIPLVALILVAVPFTLPVAAAQCTIVSPAISPDINYTTVCLFENHVYGDGTQTFDNDYVAHASHAIELDPAFNYAYVRLDQGTWTYDDGEIFQDREYTHIGAGQFAGIRGLAGGGFHANLNQREQSTIEDAGDACSSFIGQSTCLGAGAWFTVQDVGGVGVGAYYQQTGTGEACEEKADLYLTAGIVFIPLTNEPHACTTQAPYLYETVPFGELPVMP